MRCYNILVLFLCLTSCAAHKAATTTSLEDFSLVNTIRTASSDNLCLTLNLDTAATINVETPWTPAQSVPVKSIHIGRSQATTLIDSLDSELSAAHNHVATSDIAADPASTISAVESFMSELRACIVILIIIVVLYCLWKTFRITH